MPDDGRRWGNMFQVLITSPESWSCRIIYSPLHSWCNQMPSSSVSCVNVLIYAKNNKDLDRPDACRFGFGWFDPCENCGRWWEKIMLMKLERSSMSQRMRESLVRIANSIFRWWIPKFFTLVSFSLIPSLWSSIMVFRSIPVRRADDRLEFNLMHDHISSCSPNYRNILKRKWKKWFQVGDHNRHRRHDGRRCECHESTQRTDIWLWSSWFVFMTHHISFSCLCHLGLYHMHEDIIIAWSWMHTGFKLLRSPFPLCHHDHCCV